MREGPSSRRARPGTALPNSGGGERRRRQGAAQSSHPASSAHGSDRAATPRAVAQERGEQSHEPDDYAAPELCLCVSCGGQFPVDALSESAAARLVKHYRNEIHKREDRFVTVAIENSFERRRLIAALRRLWPRLLTMARDTCRPALARELERIEAAFLDDQ